VSNNKTTSVRNSFLSIACAVFFLVFASIGASWAQDCQTELGSSTGYVTLASGDTTSKEKKIDEWSGDVIKLRTNKPGVLVVEAVGTGAQNALYAGSSSGPHPLLDSSRLGTGLRELQAIVRAGDHCIQVVPPAGATGDYRVEASFVDICHLGDLDDHGDSFLCATPISVSGTKSGEITSTLTTTDHDMFSLVVSTTASYSIESSGSTDVSASLLDSEGGLLDADDNSGTTSPNFKIVETLSAGQYYIQVKGANGSYSFSVTQLP
jgi:hypothetical protein